MLMDLSKCEMAESLAELLIVDALGLQYSFRIVGNLALVNNNVAI
jgi:hypothetical protein